MTIENTNSKNCNHDCSNCSKNKNCKNKIKKLTTNENSNIKHIIGVVSGKGGVGKSLVCSLLAKNLSERKYKVGILDADVTGPSIPKIFGSNKKLSATKKAVNPNLTQNNIKIVSSNLILDDKESPVAWRGPVVTGAISQFFNMTNWGSLDYLLVDMPPGTSDVFLSVAQLFPIDGIVCVSTPQNLVEMIVNKAINLSKMMNIEVLSIVENMSYFRCPNCKEKLSIYGESKAKDIATKFSIEAFDLLPIDPNFAKYCDEGNIEHYKSSELLKNTISKLEDL